MTPTVLVLIGLLGAVTVNIIHFCINLVIALLRAPKSETEDQFERLMAPALTGQADLLAPSVSAVFGWLTTLLLLVAASGFAWALISWLQT